MTGNLNRRSLILGGQVSDHFHGHVEKKYGSILPWKAWLEHITNGHRARCNILIEELRPLLALMTLFDVFLAPFM